MTSAASLVGKLEWTLLLRNGVAAALLISFAILTVMAATAGALRAGRDRDDRSRLLSGKAEAPARSVAHLALERGTFAVLPAAPLTGFAVGQSDVHPQHYHITARLSDAQLAGDQLDHPLALHAGAFDLLFVLLYLFPLLIVGTSHDLFATDRANGTLRVLAVQGAPLSAVVRGRLATRLLLVVLLPLAASVLTALVIDPLMLGSGRFLLWMAGAILYGLFWLGVAVHVNARGRSGMANALLLSAAWLLFVIVVPSLLNLVTRVVYPVPSRVQLATAMREASRQAVAEGSQTLGRYLEDHPSAGTGVEGMRQFYMLQDLRDAAVARQLQPVLSAFQDQLARQAWFVSLTQYASPTVIAQLALTDVAGTSGHRARAFADQAAVFQRAWKASFPVDVLADSASAPTDLPVFEFAEAPFATTARRIAAPFFVLAFVSGLLLWSGARQCQRLELVPS
jgi:ABC-2 type transport system permease protein